MEREGLEIALEALGDLLESRGLSYELFAIGGGSLLLTERIARATKDLDVVALASGEELITARPLPKDLIDAVADVGGLLNLATDWLNGGPTDLLDFGLPQGFSARTQRKTYGTLVVNHASRIDQVFLKLYAMVDNGPNSKHAQDLIQLKPTRQELVDAESWCVTHDTSEGFRGQLTQALDWMEKGDAS